MQIKTSQDIINILKQHNVSYITNHSKRVAERCAFFIEKVNETRAYTYAQEAIEQGVQLVLTSHSTLQKLKRVIYVKDLKDLMPQVIDTFYPRVPRQLFFVTGTNGKTSVAYYIFQFLSKLGYTCASIGTLGVITNINSFTLPHYCAPGLTTPDHLVMRQILDFLSAQGVTHVALEVSSHGIEQKRLGKLKSDRLIFTSFAPEHGEYHSTIENYLNAKLKLFYQYSSIDAVIIVAYDIYHLIPDTLKNRFQVYTVGQHKKADISFVAKYADDCTQEISFIFAGKSFKTTSGIICSYQASNILMAMFAILQHKDICSIDVLVKLITTLTAPSGRLEKPITTEKIFVDYAHNVDSLQRVLSELKLIQNYSSPKSRLIIVFGCGGDRDQEKRPRLGAIANKHADIVIITDDNPRNEDAALIRKHIQSTCEKAIEIPIRLRAIMYALSIKKKQDIVLIAGKGHENYQILGNTKYYSKTDSQIVKFYYEYFHQITSKADQ